jgi:hypothetical protein
MDTAVLRTRVLNLVYVYRVLRTKFSTAAVHARCAMRCVRVYTHDQAVLRTIIVIALVPTHLSVPGQVHTLEYILLLHRYYGYS